MRRLFLGLVLLFALGLAGLANAQSDNPPDYRLRVPDVEAYIEALPDLMLIATEDSQRSIPCVFIARWPWKPWIALRKPSASMSHCSRIRGEPPGRGWQASTSSPGTRNESGGPAIVTDLGRVRLGLHFCGLN